MLKLDTATFLATQDRPGGPIYLMEEDRVESITPLLDENGKPTEGGKIGYVLAYAILMAFFAYLYFAL